MSVLGDVFDTLHRMDQLQLLLAFVACTGYTVAQGGLISAKGRRIAWAVTILAAFGFAFESAQWMYAAMLVTFGVAGLGLFVAAAWLLSRVLGFSKPRATAEAVELADSIDADYPLTHAPSTHGPRTLSQHTGPAHSI